MSEVCISAGHNPRRKGASFEDFNEHDEAVIWAEELTKLVSYYTTVDLVPTGSLKQKVKFINQADAKLAVEIHFNSAKTRSGKPVGKGSETLYYPGSVMGQAAARIMQEYMTEVFLPDRGTKEGHLHSDPNNAPLYFLRATNCLSLIVEPEFIHRKDTIQFNRTGGCEVMANAIEDILRSLKNGH